MERSESVCLDRLIKYRLKLAAYRIHGRFTVNYFDKLATCNV